VTAGGAGTSGAGGAGRAPLRLYLGAFGDPGHAFPMLALGRELVARGHEVTFQTWDKWRDLVEAEGIRFTAAPEYQVFPTRDRPLKPYEAAVRAARETLPEIEALAPHAVVADIITLAPALAGEMAGVPVATLVPHVHPAGGPGFPPYSIGARLPRTAVGRAFWNSIRRPVENGLRQGQAELNETRARLDLPPVDRFHGGISERLCLVGTFPQLEYPREWPAGAHVVGPLLWEPPGERVEPPPGSGPVVLVAPSTSQDPEQKLLRAALEGLADEPVRVIATTNTRPPGPGALPPRSDTSSAPLKVPANARLVDWLSYSRTMPGCDVVVCHGGHGTVARALESGCAVVVCPAGGDMNENGARVAWAGAGTRLPPRFTGSARAVRLAVRQVLADSAMHDRARAIAEWSRGHSGAAGGADLLEDLTA
jgi:UDP:flavonoid glycosyltransferase YjiC (YdhE family)